MISWSQMQALGLLPAGCLLQRNFSARSRGWLWASGHLYGCLGRKISLSWPDNSTDVCCFVCDVNITSMRWDCPPSVLAVLSRARVCGVVAVLTRNLP